MIGFAATFRPVPARQTIVAGLLSLLLLGCGASLHDLVAAGDVPRAEALLKKDPSAAHSVNKLGKTPLHYAVSYKQVPCMELLLKHGADINAQDRTGMTPLHVAAMLGRKQEAIWLLEHGAALEPRDEFGDTPAHTAALFGQGHLVKLFLDRGADLAARNLKQKTPLDLARDNRQEKAARYIENLLAPQAPAGNGP